MMMSRFNFIKNDSAYIEPKVIMSAVVALIFIVVTLFAVFSIGEIQQEFNPQYSGIFQIDDPNIDQVCDTNRFGMTGLSVVQVMNNGDIVLILSANYTYIQDIVTVDEAVIWG